MRLHIYNIDHDIALAANLSQFTPPHVCRQMWSDLGFLPVFWAEDGDLVLVDDVEAALEQLRHFKVSIPKVVFVTDDDLRNTPFTNIDVEPWGWDVALQKRLLKLNPMFASSLPTSSQLAFIRHASNRTYAADHILPQIVSIDSRLTGTSRYVTHIDKLRQLLDSPKVLKAPWSCSGRGVRYVEEPKRQVMQWAANIIRQQGGIMVEPLYNKVCDFGMEFHVGSDGSADYCGLSLFKTSNGAYQGNILASEKKKNELLNRYLPQELLSKVREALSQRLSALLGGHYEGPLGIDMMVVAGDSDDDTGTDGFLLHPCVEMNLRRTMGHVALALSKDEQIPQRLMNISFEHRFKFKIQNTFEDALNTMVY